MSAVSITIKLLSGEVLPLEVPSYMTCALFYSHVYHHLPEEIVPKEEYMMTLFRSFPGQELLCGDEELNAEEGEEFYVYLDTSKYEVDLEGVWWETFDLTRQMNPLFRQWVFRVARLSQIEHQVIHNEAFYHNEDESAWFLRDRVDSQMTGRRLDEEVIRIPDDETAYLSIERIGEVMIGRIPDLSNRVRAYLQERLTWLWIDHNVLYGDQPEEPEPYHEDLPEEPWGTSMARWWQD